MAADLFAGISVRDFGTALPWYVRLFGSEPSFLPHDPEAVWELAEGRFVYIDEDPDRARAAVLTVFPEDLDATVDGIAERGLEPHDRETYSNGVRKITFRDADGNEVGFGGGP